MKKTKEQIQEEKQEERRERREILQGHKALDDLINRAQEKGAFIEEIKPFNNPNELPRGK
jgi:hypothetical protein